MNVSVFNLAIVFITYSVCQSPSNWAESLPGRIEHLRVVYNKLKQDPDRFFKRHEMRVEDLKSLGKNSSDYLTTVLYEQGYLKVQKNGEVDELKFYNNSDLMLYMDLVYLAKEKDEICNNALEKIKSFFERMPPEIDDFKSFMLALDTVLSKIPRIICDWELRAIVGALYFCGLKVQVGGTVVDHHHIYCEDLANNTRLRIVVAEDHDYGQNATQAWENYYRDILLPGLLDGPRKNILAMLLVLPYPHKKSNSTIHDWYGDFEFVDRQIHREYRP